jgi:hypothetical protein
MSNTSSIKIERPDDNKMCELGYHVVNGHTRVCKSGTSTWVDTHIRKNRSKKFMYLEENLLFFFWNNIKTYKTINAAKGFPPYHELDPIIQFWLDYWREQGIKLPVGITPLHIKVLIAIESSFNVIARPKTTTAVGLMQILNGARNSLAGTLDVKNNEVKDYHVYVTELQLENPIINIAVGIRWLAHKFCLIRKHKDKSLEKTIKFYHSNDQAGEKYANKILNLYEQSK